MIKYIQQQNKLAIYNMYEKKTFMFDQYSSTPSSPKKNNPLNMGNNYEMLNSVSINPQCQHHRKILQLKQKIKELQSAQHYLMKKNDDIISGMERMALRQREENQESQIWRKKYQQLKADNDKKALRLATKTTFEPKSAAKFSIQRQVERPRARQQSSRQLRIQEDFKNRRQYENMQKLLTRQQREYVRQLQQIKRERSGSLKAQNRKQVRKYSAVLPDGLVIHILDDRPRGMSIRQ